MVVSIEPSWKSALESEFAQTYFCELTHFVKEAYSSGSCYPKGKDIFSAFWHCTLPTLKVVIIGQDPYHGEGQANGLCFSVADGVRHPPSLANIFKELESDLKIPYPESGNLERWARQGVMLLNTTLTVSSGLPGSHAGRGWETFTDRVIKCISERKDNVVFLLWGSFAKQKTTLIDTRKHIILTSGHPSPLSANRGLWFGNKHFSKCNAYLLSTNQSPIAW